MISKLVTARLLPRYFIRKNFKISAKQSPTIFYSTEKPSSTVELDAKTISLLEKLSLVNFEDQKYVKIVESAIEFAGDINAINTDNVEPLVTVLEDRSLKLREDVVTEGNCQKEILQNAALREEDYFVAPPGNIPVDLQKLKE